MTIKTSEQHIEDLEKASRLVKGFIAMPDQVRASIDYAISLIRHPPTAEYEIKYAHLMQALGAESHEHALAVIADIRTAAVLMAKAQDKRNARAKRNLGAKS